MRSCFLHVLRSPALTFYCLCGQADKKWPRSEKNKWTVPLSSGIRAPRELGCAYSFWLEVPGLLRRWWVINVERRAAALAQTPLKLVIHADRLRQSNTRRHKLGSCLLLYCCIYLGYPVVRGTKEYLVIIHINYVFW